MGVNSDLFLSASLTIYIPWHSLTFTLDDCESPNLSPCRKEVRFSPSAEKLSGFSWMCPKGLVKFFEVAGGFPSVTRHCLNAFSTRLVSVISSASSPTKSRPDYPEASESGVESIAKLGYALFPACISRVSLGFAARLMTGHDPCPGRPRNEANEESRN